MPADAPDILRPIPEWHELFVLIDEFEAAIRRQVADPLPGPADIGQSIAECRQRLMAAFEPLCAICEILPVGMDRVVPLLDDLEVQIEASEGSGDGFNWRIHRAQENLRVVIDHLYFELAQRGDNKHDTPAFSRS